MTYVGRFIFVQVTLAAILKNIMVVVEEHGFVSVGLTKDEIVIKWSVWGSYYM